MRIACLGWGSLVWDPRELPIRREWFCDGPLLPIEFARKSNDGRVTLVLDQNVPEVRSLWSLMSVTDLDEAIKALAEREGLTGKDKTKNIGYWRDDHKPDKNLGVAAICNWAKMIGIEAVIWTSLESNFTLGTQTTLADKVLTYLRTLPFEKFRHAERYIRRTPKQIDTDVRRKLELELGWFPLD